MKDYVVYCHRCLTTHGMSPSEHMRSTSVLLGNAKFGGLWHCPKHADCKSCPPTIYGEPSSPAEIEWERLRSTQKNT
jgi:hypothetical protein